MRVFITGTGTNIGKTLISAWLCLHTGYAYYKPIQTGRIEGTDSETVQTLAGVPIVPEVAVYDPPVSPHLAAKWAKRPIQLNHIPLPEVPNLIIEGAGGLLVPLNEQDMIIDLIAHFATPVILVASSELGTINHTLLSLAALRHRNLPVLGVILSGPLNPDNKAAIATYGKIPVLAELPQLTHCTRDSLLAHPLSSELKTALGVS